MYNKSPKKEFGQQSMSRFSKGGASVATGLKARDLSNERSTQ